MIEDLLEDRYEYVLVSRFLTDPLERHFSKYRQISGGRFLISLIEATNSERILRVHSLIKENVNIWDEDLILTIDMDSIMDRIEEKLSKISTELLEVELMDDSKEVAVTISGYIAKKLSKRSKCRACPSKMIGHKKTSSMMTTY